MGSSRAIVLVLVSAVALVAGCAPGDRNPATEEATPLSIPEGSDGSSPPIDMPGAVSYQGSTQLGDANRLGIELQNFAFAPTFVEAVPAAAGRTISVTLENVSSGTDHTFTIEGVGVDVEVPALTDARIDLTIPPSPGRLVYYCRYHRAQGMQGALFLAGVSL